MSYEFLSSRDFIDKVIEENYEDFYNRCGIVLSADQKEEAYRILHARAAFHLISLRDNKVIEPLKLAKENLGKNNCEEARVQVEDAKKELNYFDNKYLTDELYNQYVKAVEFVHKYFIDGPSISED